jgi:hypothetical protein
LSIFGKIPSLLKLLILLRSKKTVGSRAKDEGRITLSPMPRKDPKIISRKPSASLASFVSIARPAMLSIFSDQIENDKDPFALN